MKPSSCGTATRSATWARASPRPWPTSTACWPRSPLAAMPATSGADRAMIAPTAPRTRPSSAPTPSSASAWPRPRPPRRARLPLYRYIGGDNARVLPVPMANIINGGKHADNKIDFQEFMVMPVAPRPSPRPSAWWPRSSTAQGRAEEGRAQHQRRRRGRLRPQPRERREPQLILDAISKAGYTAGRDKDIAIALDCASSELFDEGDKKGYKFWKSAPDKIFSSQQMRP